MTAALAVGLVFYSIVIIAATWVVARRPQKTSTTQVVNAQASAIAQQVADQHQVLKEIDDDVSKFNLANYLNGDQPRQSAGPSGVAGPPPGGGDAT